MQTPRAQIRLELRFLDTKARTAEATLSSDSPIRFSDGFEVLSHAEGAIDLTRAAAPGLPLLFAHDQTISLGLVENVRSDGRRLKGLLRFGSSAKALEVWQDAAAGLMPYISVGYRLLAPPTPVEGGFVIPKWMPYEVSVVTVPMDATVGIGRSYSQEGTMKTTPTTTAPSGAEGNEETQDSTTTAATREAPALASRKAQDILRNAEKTLGKRIVDDLARRQLPLDELRSVVQAELARFSESFQIRSQAHLPETHGGSSADVNSPDGRVQLYSEVLAARCGGPAPGEAARQFMNLRCMDMARDLLEVRGISTTFMGKSEIITRALHGTADFPNLLSSTGNRVLRRAYDTYKGGLRRACRQSTARDFRAKQILALSEAPKLEKVNEHGEFKRTAKMSETVESYKLSTFGKIFGITRQALVNDDLDAFGQMSQKFGIAAGEFESQTVVDLLASNPTMGDGIALFHASHGNLGTAAALGTDSLGAARLAMRMQKGLDDKTPIDVSGRYIIVPAALELQLDKCLVPVPGADVGSKANLFAGFYDKIVDPRLDAYSTVNWYMSSDPDLFDTIEYSYLEEQPGPQVHTREGFDVDGLEIKVTLDFGAGVLDHRGLYKGIAT